MALVDVKNSFAPQKKETFNFTVCVVSCSEMSNFQADLFLWWLTRSMNYIRLTEGLL